MTSFAERVRSAVRAVPPGRVTTYGDVAVVAGSPRAARRVGQVLAGLPADTDVPWQRVINAQGRVSHRGDTLRADLQTALLREEGVAFDDSGRCDLDALRWPFDDLVP